MGKKILALVLAMLLCVGAQVALADYIRATGNVTVRSSPSLSGSELGTIWDGNTETYLGSTSTDARGVDWYKISYRGGTGWVSSKYAYVTSTSSSPVYYDYDYVYATGNVTVRGSASLSGSEKGTLYSGNTASYAGSSSVDSRGVTWYKIYFKGGTGWVSSAYSYLTDDSSPVPYVTNSSYTYVYATGNVTVRSSASLSGSEKGTLYKGNTASYTGSSSVDGRGVTWYKINFNGGTGWVSSAYSYLTDNYSHDTYDSGSSYSYVYATGNVTVRSSASLSGSEKGTLYKGNTASYTGSSSVDGRGVTWYKINFNGGTGWVSSAYSYLTNSYSSGGGGTTSSSSGSYVYANGNVTVRSSASLSGSEKGTLYAGSTANYLGSKSTDSRGVVWYKISFKGGSGWVSSKYASLY